MKRFIEKIIENKVLTSFIVFLGATLGVVITTSILYGYDEPFLENILVEAYGMLFDILIIGIIILWLNKRREKKLEIQRYHNEIDDFRFWESEEAMFRIVGNIKRLNRMNVSKISLFRCHLKNAQLFNMNLSGAMLAHANLQM